MGRSVIAVFRPKPGKDRELFDVVSRHWRVLCGQGLVTERARHVMRAVDGTIVEVFEWRSAQAIEQAHRDPLVQALWTEFEAACDYVPLASLAEAQQLFPEFETLQMP